MASIYNISREHQAQNPFYLREVRRMCFICIALQLTCFIGYWTGMILMYQLSWTIWLTISTICIMVMGIKFGESYIILVTAKYTLNHNRVIPKKYIKRIYAFWLISSLINITGTILRFMDQKTAQSICYAIWAILCSISICFLIYILKSIRGKFVDIMMRKLQVKQQKDESVSDRLLPRESNAGMLMKSEIKRMSVLLIGLYLLIIVFLINAILNVLQNILSDLDLDETVWMIAYIYFPQWTIINVFVLVFSWIPRSQMMQEFD